MVEDPAETGSTAYTEELSEKSSEVLQELFDTIGSRLKSIRLEKGMTQLDVHKMFGISNVYISDAEHGKRNLTLRKLCLLANAYGYNIAVLIETDEDVKLITKGIKEFRLHERDYGKYVQALESIRDEVDAVLGHKGKGG